jgi:hypothetical protein
MTARLLRFPSPPIARPRTLTADLRETVEALDSLFHGDVCSVCARDRDDHGPMHPVMACVRRRAMTNHETRR